MRICQNPRCGKEFWTYPAWLKNNGGVYCSIRCKQQVNIYKYLLAGDKYKHPWTNEMKQELREKFLREKNPAWKGGVTYFKTHGNYIGVKYVKCPTELLLMARKDGYVMEHRLVVAQFLNRCLLRTEVVHHIDHDPSNNDLSNLILFSSNMEHKLFEGRENART
jgi:hypothetical protein